MTAPPITAIVTSPGVYRMSADVYLSDACCETPSLNASIVNALIDECPAMAWQEHPRLNPNPEGTFRRYFDIGRAGHLLMLEPELFDTQTVVLQADNYQQDWVQGERRRAYRDGKTPLLLRERDMLLAMRAQLMKNERVCQAFKDAKTERSIFAKDAATGIWRRCRPDLTAYHGGWLADYKVVESCNPREFSSMAWRYKWNRRAVWYLETFRLATGADPQDYWFITQSKHKPYLATVQALDFVDLDLGRRECDKACEIFAECLARGTDFDSWPGYRNPSSPDHDTAFRHTLPPYAHQQIEFLHAQWAEAEQKKAVDLVNSAGLS